MAHRGLNWRIAIILVGIVMAILYGVFLNEGPSYVIIIDYGGYPQELDDTEVVIDGEVVGRLTRRSGRPRTGFRVDEGDHVVSLRHPDFASEPRELTTGFGAGQLHLMVDIEERYRGDASEITLVLR